MPTHSTCTTGRRPKAAGEGTRGEQGSPRNWHNAMKISARPLVRERMDAWPEVCGEPRNDALQLPQRRNGPACAATSSLTWGQIGSVAMLPGEHRPGRHESGGEDSGQSVLKRLRCCS
jgi:hypothetical protein